MRVARKIVNTCHFHLPNQDKTIVAMKARQFLIQSQLRIKQGSDYGQNFTDAAFATRAQ